MEAYLLINDTGARAHRLAIVYLVANTMSLSPCVILSMARYKTRLSVGSNIESRSLRAVA